MARTTPTVWVSWSGSQTRAEIQLASEPPSDIRLDTPAWLAWLEAPTTSSFAYAVYDRQAGYIRGFLTIRKEKRRRGSHYWVAYRRIGGRLRKIYLGRSAELTQRQLAAIAERFLSMEAPAGAAQKEVMPGQSSGASFKWEVTLRRVKSRHQVAHIGRLLVAHYGRRWWHIHGRLLTIVALLAFVRYPAIGCSNDFLSIHGRPLSVFGVVSLDMYSTPVLLCEQ